MQGKANCQIAKGHSHNELHQLPTETDQILIQQNTLSAILYIMLKFIHTKNGYYWPAYT